MDNQAVENRKVYFDYMRVFATIAVILLHISGDGYNTTAINSLHWHVLEVSNSLVRWGVSVFVMISGALFLSRDIPLKKIYSKYILHLATAFFTWSIFYAIIGGGTLSERVLAVFSGHFHMWFIPMIIGLYMCIPFIKPIANNQKISRYYIILSFLLVFIIPEINSLIGDFGTYPLTFIPRIFSALTGNLSIKMVLGFPVFFVLGHHLNTVILDKKQRRIIYILGIIGFLSTIMLCIVVTMKTGKACTTYLKTFTVNVFLEALAVFVWFKYKKWDNIKLNNIMIKLSKYCFGAYLIHPLIIRLIKKIVLQATLVRPAICDSITGLNTFVFNPIISIIFITITVTVMSYVISIILNHIPFIRRTV